jgi:hypothetical protein
MEDLADFQLLEEVKKDREGIQSIDELLKAYHVES